MDLYPWSFDSIHSHCHDDVISILNILKEFLIIFLVARYRARDQKTQFEREPAQSM
jgi:hypothetical protein